MAPTGLDELEALKRDILRGLVRGASPEDIAWAVAQPSDRIVTLAREALVDLDADLARPLSTDERRRIGDYLLRRQSPGQAAGTWELMEESAAARRWAVWVRECLAGIYDDQGPPLPDGASDAVAPSERTRAVPSKRDGLGEQRKAREKAQFAAVAQEAVAQEISPFRQEAIEHYRTGQDAIKLPHYASRPARYALVGIVVLLLTGLAMCIVVKVPVHTTGKVLVTELGDGAPGPQRGLSVVAIFPPSAGRDLKNGQNLRVKLPDTDERVSTRIVFVEDRTRSAQRVVERYGLDRGQANRVRGPSTVAVAPLRLPPGSPPRASFTGAVTSEAEVRTGSTRIIGLLF